MKFVLALALVLVVSLLKIQTSFVLMIFIIICDLNYTVVFTAVQMLKHRSDNNGNGRFVFLFEIVYLCSIDC